MYLLSYWCVVMIVSCCCQVGILLLRRCLIVYLRCAHDVAIACSCCFGVVDLLSSWSIRCCHVVVNLMVCCGVCVLLLSVCLSAFVMVF